MSDERLHCWQCGKIHPNAQLVSLHDGRIVGNYSSEWMLECEARYVVRLTTLERRRKYIDQVAEKRGQKACLELQDRIRSIWNSSKQAQPKVAENIGNAAVETPATAPHGQPGKTGFFQQIATRDLSFDF